MSEISFKENVSTHDREAILDSLRIEAFKKCDADVLYYDPANFIQVIFQLKGRNMRLIAMPLLLSLLWGILWCILFQYDDSLRDALEPIEDLVSQLLIPVSFLLVFRLGRAAIRFWDARAAMGRLVEGCRVLSSSAVVQCYMTKGYDDSFDENDIDAVEEDELADLFACWVCAVPIAVKNFLRPIAGEGKLKGSERRCADGQRETEIGSLLDAQDTIQILHSEKTIYAPILVLNQLRLLAYEISFTDRRKTQRTEEEGDREHVNTSGGAVYRQLNDEIDALTGAWGAMERINSTPLPFAYVAHLRTFLMIYLALLHVEATAHLGWVSLLPLFATSWGLLGIEAASVECERPFGWSSNHLPLGKMCIVVAKNVSQTLDDVKIGIRRRRQQRQQCRKK